ncbi:unnamed protein product [Choristocarpus tenellus]
MVRNPSLLWKADIGGYFLHDRSGKHNFQFPEKCTILARGSITVYCSPGQLSDYELNTLGKGNLMWLNQDGSLRRKEVLNNDGDEIMLSDREGVEVASILTIPSEEDEDEDEFTGNDERDEIYTGNRRRAGTGGGMASNGGSAAGGDIVLMRFPGVKRLQVLDRIRGLEDESKIPAKQMLRDRQHTEIPLMVRCIYFILT